jgi:hypothetical protein
MYFSGGTTFATELVTFVVCSNDFVNLKQQLASKFSGAVTVQIKMGNGFE